MMLAGKCPCVWTNTQLHPATANHVEQHFSPALFLGFALCAHLSHYILRVPYPNPYPFVQFSLGDIVRADGIGGCGSPNSLIHHHQSLAQPQQQPKSNCTGNSHYRKSLTNGIDNKTINIRIIIIIIKSGNISPSTPSSLLDLHQTPLPQPPHQFIIIFINGTKSHCLGSNLELIEVGNGCIMTNSILCHHHVHPTSTQINPSPHPPCPNSTSILPQNSQKMTIVA